LKYKIRKRRSGLRVRVDARGYKGEGYLMDKVNKE